MKYLFILCLLLTSCTNNRNNDYMPLTGNPQIDCGIMQLNMQRDNR